MTLQIWTSAPKAMINEPFREPLSDKLEAASQKRKEEFARRKRVRAAQKQQELRERARKRFEASVPAELKHAKLNNYERSTPEQDAAIARLLKVCETVDSFCRQVGKVFLWGPVGRGKDHCLVAVGKAAAQTGRYVRFESWPSLAHVASGYGTEADEAFRRAIEPDVLILSDAILHRDPKPYKAATLHRLIDKRWNLGRPTWVSCNASYLTAADEPENTPHSAQRLLGGDLFSRLTEKAVVIRFNGPNWPDYRGLKELKL